MRSILTVLTGGTLPALALAFLLSLTGQATAEGPSCTDAYLLCINEATDGGADGWDLSEELGAIECGASWAGCVLRRFRNG